MSLLDTEAIPVTDLDWKDFYKDIYKPIPKRKSRSPSHSIPLQQCIDYLVYRYKRLTKNQLQNINQMSHSISFPASFNRRRNSTARFGVVGYNAASSSMSA